MHLFKHLSLENKIVLADKSDNHLATGAAWYGFKGKAMEEQDLLSCFLEEAEKSHTRFTIDSGVNLCKCPPYTQFVLLLIEGLMWYSTKHYQCLLGKRVSIFTCHSYFGDHITKYDLQKLLFKFLSR